MKEIELLHDGYEKAPGRVEVPSDSETRYWVVWEALFGVAPVDFQSLPQEEQLALGRELSESATVFAGERGKKFRKPHWLKDKQSWEVWHSVNRYCSGELRAGDYLDKAARLIRREYRIQLPQLTKRLEVIAAFRNQPMAMPPNQAEVFAGWLELENQPLPLEQQLVIQALMSEAQELGGF